MELKKITQNIKDYAKCLVANKPALYGAVAIPTATAIGVNHLFGEPLETNALNCFLMYANGMFLASGLTASGMTAAGTSTFKAYKRCQGHLQKYNSEKGLERFKEMPCTNMGLKLALKEFNQDQLNLESIIK
jgi:hypothetical protein